MKTHNPALAQEMVASAAIPLPLKEQITADLEDAIRKDFHIDCDQLSANLARLTARPR